MDNKSTIVAIATPRGIGAIGVIRMSGSVSLDIIDKIFETPKKDNLKKTNPNTVHYGFIKNNKENVDEVLVTIMKEPHTYTGENLVEISCHNNQSLMTEVLELCIKHGAVLAKPGEFTLRAFLNGKKDLIQAEAVSSLISAESRISEKFALKSLLGKFTEIINEWRNQIIEILSDINVRLDHDENETLEDLNYKDLKNRIEIIKIDMQNKLKHSKEIHYMAQGIKAVLVGKPNVGKSSLLNALVKEQKAIVSKIAGTTRDPVEGCLEIEGVKVNFVDTAGIRENLETNDLNNNEYIEFLGIKKTKEHIEKSDYVIFIIDLSNSIDENDLLITDHLKKIKEGKIILVGNKADIKKQNDAEKILAGLKHISFLETSAVLGTNIDKLKSILVSDIKKENYLHEESIMVNLRQKNLIEQSVLNLNTSVENLTKQEPLEIITIDINNALTNLNEIIGINVSDEILNKIFSSFCVGK